MPSHVILVGTRGSALARAQAGWVIELLRKRFPDEEFAERVIATGGDRGAAWSRARSEQGIFVREIEDALARDEIRLAVHSVKDLPTRLPAGLKLAAVPERADPRDALISRAGAVLATLPRGAVVGTGSVRRRAMLLRSRPDLRVVDFRGNLDTRLNKLAAGEVDAIVVAAAGLVRLGREEAVTEYLDPALMLPAPCQGALGIEIRERDELAASLCSALDDPALHAGVRAERSLLHALTGGCRVPVGALARVAGDDLVIEGMVVSPGGERMVRRTARGPRGEAERIGASLAAAILDAGGTDILAEARGHG